MVLLKHYLTTAVMQLFNLRLNLRISIQLYEHQNQTIFFATVLAFVRHPVYCTIFQCQKVCFTLFTSFDHLLNHFALLFERQLKEVRRLRRALRRVRTASGLMVYICHWRGLKDITSLAHPSDFHYSIYSTRNNVFVQLLHCVLLI